MSKEQPMSNRLHIASMFMASILSSPKSIKSVKEAAEKNQLSDGETMSKLCFFYADELIKQESLTLQK